MRQLVKNQHRQDFALQCAGLGTLTRPRQGVGTGTVVTPKASAGQNLCWNAIQGKARPPATVAT